MRFAVNIRSQGIEKKLRSSLTFDRVVFVTGINISKAALGKRVVSLRSPDVLIL